VDQSITLVKNQQKLIPLDRGKSVLFIEWEKVKATIPINEAEPVFMLKKAAGRFFPDSDFCLQKLDRNISKNLTDLLPEPDYVVAGVYSRSPALEELQGAAVKKILGIRPDLIVVALGNPFDLRHFPLVKTYLATYGFRDTQTGSLFKLLTGEIEPSGRLPFSIKLE
jgi:beta-N-acetylhexosaminidase